MHSSEPLNHGFVIYLQPMEHGLKALNLVYVCTINTDTEKKDALIVKLVKELDHHPCPIDNDRELHNWLQLNKHKVGVPLLARCSSPKTNSNGSIQ